MSGWMDVPHTCMGPDAHAVWDMDACSGCMQRGFTDFSSDKQRLFSVLGSGYEIAISLGGTGAYRTPKRPSLAVSWREKQRHSGPVLQNEGGSALCWSWLSGATRGAVRSPLGHSWGGWDSRGVREEREGDLTRPQQSVIPQPQHRVQGAQHGLCGALKGPSW